MSLHWLTLEVNAWGEVGAGNITSNDEVSFLLPCGTEDETAMVDAETHSDMKKCETTKAIYSKGKMYQRSRSTERSWSTSGVAEISSEVRLQEEADQSVQLQAPTESWKLGMRRPAGSARSSWRKKQHELRKITVFNFWGLEVDLAPLCCCSSEVPANLDIWNQFLPSG